MALHLVVFGRLPHHSLSAKTRLGKEIGDMEKAKNIGHSLTKKTLETFANISAQKYFCYGGDVPESDLQDFKKQYTEYSFFPQAKGKDVRGLKEAFAYIYRQDDKAHVVIIGTDIIGLNEAIVHECFKKLEDNDVAIVRVEDNGYGLIGLSKNVDIISGIRNFESRSPGYNLVEETKSLCKSLQCSLWIHPSVCFDIDTQEDANSANLL